MELYNCLRFRALKVPHTFWVRWDEMEEREGRREEEGWKEKDGLHSKARTHRWGNYPSGDAHHIDMGDIRFHDIVS